MGVLAGSTSAQSPPADPGPNAEPEEKPKAASDADPATGTESKVERRQRARGMLRDSAKGFTRLEKPDHRAPKPVKAGKRRGRAGFTADPNAKWACANQTVDLGKVWRGNQQLTFGFDIRNEGTSVLKIRARGG
jgi:hypothetical protein